MNQHRLAEERGLAYHRAVVERLLTSPRALEVARERVQAWSQAGSVHPHYVDAWTRLLELPLEDLCVAIVDTSDRGRALRQVTPFAGLIDPKERWRIWRDVRSRVLGP